MTAWRGTEVAGATIAGLPALHLAFLMATGAAAAALTLVERDGSPRWAGTTTEPRSSKGEAARTACAT
jgi:hypothetical protein